jgi:hypothetical protein
VPTSTDNVLLAANGTTGANLSVVVNITTATCANLQIGGSSADTRATLTFSNSGNPKLTATGTVTIGGSGSTNANRGGTITFLSGATLEAGSIVLTQSTAGNNNDNPGTITMTSGSTLITGSFAVGQGTATWTPSTGNVKLKSTNTLPASAFTSFNSLQITGGTTTMGRSISCSTLVIDASTQLNVASSKTLTINNGTGTDLTVNGTLSNAGTITQSASTTAAFNAGSTYTHALDGGTIPTATWNVTSTCVLTQWTSSGSTPSGLGQNFGNFKLAITNDDNGTNPGDLGTMSIAGNFIVANAAGQDRPIGLKNDDINDATLTIGGDLIIQSGNFYIESSANSGLANGGSSITVNGNYNQTGGTFDLNAASNSTTLNVKGDFSQTGGTITESGASATGNIIFNGSATQVFTS